MLWLVLMAFLLYSIVIDRVYSISDKPATPAANRR